jgi:D-alanyl-D-alanine carboxypeptidase
MGVLCRALALIAVALLGVQPAAAAEPADPPRTVFEEIAARAVAKNATPGFAFVVVHRRHPVYARGFGLADVARNEPVTADTPFAIGSLSKQFTAGAVLQLRDAGKLHLEDPLARYVPSLPNAEVITLRMLLNQTSGLHNFANPTEHVWPISGSIPPRRLFTILATDHPDFAPGARFAYSNTNYAALAEVVARVTRVSYDDYLRERIFTPLGMKSAGSGYAAQQKPHATPYVGAHKFTVPAPIVSLDLFYGAGSIIASASDLARWDAALMGGTLLSSASMNDLWSAGHLTNGRPIPYAMGFMPTSLAGHREVWHNGFAPNAGGLCYNAIFPDDGLAVIVLTNAGEYDPRYGFQPVAEAMVREVIDAYFLHRIFPAASGAK